MTKIAVKQHDDPKRAVPVEILADSIVAISGGIKKLRDGPISDRALVLLIQAAAPTVGGKYSSAKVTVTDIKAVLDGIGDLESFCLKKKAA